MMTADTTGRSIPAKINANGRIVIPALLRQRMGVAPGDTVMLSEEDGVLRVESHRAVIRRIQKEFEPYREPGVSWADELIAERRAEAKRELEEGLG
jgi:AbrB family looped-hinge helix DNA binding protein